VSAACGSTSTTSPTTVSTAAAETPSSTPAASSGAAAPLTLVAQDFSFTPTTLQVAPGSTVTISLQNTGKVKHNFTADAVKSNVDMDPGSTTTATFTAPASGTIAFHCEYHPTKMVGTIAVTGASGTGATSATAAPATAAPATATPHVMTPSGSGTGY
jgi:plastocyanin